MVRKHIANKYLYIYPAILSRQFKLSSSKAAVTPNPTLLQKPAGLCLRRKSLLWCWGKMTKLNAKAGYHHWMKWYTWAQCRPQHIKPPHHRNSLSLHCFTARQPNLLDTAARLFFCRIIIHAHTHASTYTQAAAYPRWSLHPFRYSVTFINKVHVILGKLACGESWAV